MTTAEIPGKDMCREQGRPAFKEEAMSEELTGPFVLERDEHGHTAGISVNGFWVLHLRIGTVRNEEYAQRIVDTLNRRPAPEAKAGGEGAKTPLADEVRSVRFAFENDDNRSKRLLELADMVAAIEQAAPAAGVGLTLKEQIALNAASIICAREGFELAGKTIEALFSRAEGLTKENVRKWCGHYLPLPETGEYQCLYKEDGLSRTCPESDCPIIRAQQGGGGGQ